MRRLALLCLPLIALAVPAAALAVHGAAADGTLVVKNASAPPRVPVVTLVVDGTALGHVSTGSPGQVDTVIVDDVNNTNNIGASLTNGALTLGRKQLSDTETKFTGSDFRFRAAGGVYKIWIYGTGVNVFAVGRGTVVLQGFADPSIADGRYSIDGQEWHSLPSVPSDLIHFGSTG